MHRFLIPSYIFNTVRIKLKALALQRKYGTAPYKVYAPKVEFKPTPSYKLKFIDSFHSLSYFDLDEAEAYYGNTKYITSEIILALVEYNEMLTDDDIDKERLTYLAESIEGKAIREKDKLWFRVDTHLPKFDQDGDTYSGIIQAKAASFFIRVYKMTADEDYLKWAHAALLPCMMDVSKGGLHVKNKNVKSWVEEYKTDTPSMVLNGYIFVLIALAEYLTCKEDKKINAKFEDGIATLLVWLPYFQQGNDLLYSMYNWDICNVHYMGVSLYQFEHLYKCTKIKKLKKFIKQLEPNVDIELFARLVNS